MASTVEEIRKKIISQLNILLSNIDTLTHEDILLSIKSVNELIDIDKGYESLLNEISKNKILIEAHMNNMNNPHSLTKSAIGLNNVLNYPATSNPEDNSNEKYVLAKGLNTIHNSLKESKNKLTVIEETMKELTSKISSHISNTNNPHVTDKFMVGLSNVANYPATSDIDDSSDNKYALAKAVYDLHTKVKKIESISYSDHDKISETKSIKISTVDPLPNQWKNGDLWFVYED